MEKSYPPPPPPPPPPSSVTNPKSHSHHTNPNSTYYQHHHENSQDQKAALCHQSEQAMPAMEKTNAGEGKESAASAVVVPERWGKEGFLRDWIDCSAFDAFLASKEIAAAREALVSEARKPRDDDPNMTKSQT